MVKKSPHVRWVRPFVQIFFFVLIALFTLNKALEETAYVIPFLSTASLHALCPFGGVVSIPVCDHRNHH